MKLPTDTYAPLDLDTSGHLTELAATALADAEFELLSAACLAHAEVCSSCRARVELAAELSFRLDLDLMAGAPGAIAQPARALAKPRLPRGAVIAALAVALLGALPTVVARGSQFSELSAAFAVWLHSSLKFFTQLASAVSPDARGAFFSIGVGILLCAVGASIALRSTFAARKSHA